MFRFLSAFALVALLAGCEPAVAPSAASSTTAAQPPANVNDRTTANPLLNTPPEVFMSVIGECGNKLFGKKPDGSATSGCLSAIRESARKAGLGDISDAQLAHPYIGERWRSEMARHAR